MRKHLNNIRKHSLYEACGCKNFKEYIKQGNRIPLSSAQAYKIAANGEVEDALENSRIRELSEFALEELSKIRTEKNGKKTHNIDVPKVRKVAKKAVQLAKQKDKKPTQADVKEAAASVLSEPTPNPFGEQLEKRIKGNIKLLVSLEQLPDDAFVDADDKYDGVIKRLAKSYSELASLLRKALQ